MTNFHIFFITLPTNTIYVSYNGTLTNKKIKAGKQPKLPDKPKKCNNHGKQQAKSVSSGD